MISFYLFSFVNDLFQGYATASSTSDMEALLNLKKKKKKNEKNDEKEKRLMLGVGVDLMECALEKVKKRD